MSLTENPETNTSGVHVDTSWYKKVNDRYKFQITLTEY